MHNTVRKILLSLLLCIIMVSSVKAENVYAYEAFISENGYQVIIEDNADLLSYEEEEQLANKMQDITRYGNVAFITNEEWCSSTSWFAEDTYRRLFGTDSGTVFVIDMYNREIYIFSDGKIYDTITVAYANIITDNTYKFATKEKYYKCAEEVFDEIYTLLSGHRIAQPMKYISNILIAVIVAFIINYFIIKLSLSNQKVNKRSVMEGMSYYCNIQNVQKNFTHQTRVYDPPSSSSSGGSHSSGGGGGHSSGGGGGHRF